MTDENESADDDPEVEAFIQNITNQLVAYKKKQPNPRQSPQIDSVIKSIKVNFRAIAWE